MRRKDRERDAAFALSVIDKCEYATLAFTDAAGLPYAVPLTIVRIGNGIYFHGARSGKKAELLAASPRVCLSAVGDTNRLNTEFSTEYESAIVFGQVAEVTDESEKITALYALCERHTPGYLDHFESEIARSLAVTGVWRIEIEEITGKCKAVHT